MGFKVPALLAGWRRWWIVRWTRGKIIDPTVLMLRRGAEPRQMALSVALGFTTGVFPLCGLAAALCGCVAFLMGAACHPPVMMLANFAATPAELSLMIPFMRLGEKVTGAAPLSVAPEALWKFLTGQASHRIIIGLLHAVLGWLLSAPILIWSIYRLMLPVMTRVGSGLTLSAPKPIESSSGLEPVTLNL